MAIEVYEDDQIQENVAFESVNMITLMLEKRDSGPRKSNYYYIKMKKSKR